MKRFLYTLPVAALLMASCSDEVPGSENFGDGNVNYKISVPASFGTRAYGDGEFGDGTTARNLQYAVYDVDGETNTLIKTGTAVFDNAEDNYKNTTVSLNLAKGRSYNIVFFAQEGNGEAGSLYEFKAEANAATIEVDYTKADANSDQADCFYKLEATGVVSGPINKTITLRRPVAQINWGTDDAKEPVVTHTTVYDEDDNGEVKNYWSKMTTKAYNQFDLLAGDVVTTSEVDVTFDYAPRPATTYTFPVAKEDATAEPYKYLRMAYLFVPKAQQLIDVTLEHSQNGTSTLATVNVTGAPVQANYRTNIFGSLLTTPANYTVTKDAIFLGDYNKKYDEVATAEELASFLMGNTDYAAVLTQDIVVDSKLQTFSSESREINLNGHTLNIQGEGLNVPQTNGEALMVWTELKIVGGEGDQRGKIVCDEDVQTLFLGYAHQAASADLGSVGDIEIENVDIEFNNPGARANPFLIFGTHTTLKNVTIKTAGNTFNVIDSFQAGNLTIEGCKIYQTGHEFPTTGNPTSWVIQRQQINPSLQGKIVIKDSEISSYSGILYSQDTDIEIDGCKFGNFRYPGLEIDALIRSTIVANGNNKFSINNTNIYSENSYISISNDNRENVTIGSNVLTNTLSNWPTNYGVYWTSTTGLIDISSLFETTSQNATFVMPDGTTTKDVTLTIKSK